MRWTTRSRDLLDRAVKAYEKHVEIQAKDLENRNKIFEKMTALQEVLIKNFARSQGPEFPDPEEAS